VYKGKHVFLQTHESVRYERKIRCEGIGSFSLPKAVTPTATATATEGHEEANYLLTTFVPETKGKPAKLALLRYPDALGTASNSKIPVASKSFYQAEECKAMWSPKGDAALLLTSTTVDSSGDSYYGSSNLYLITAAGDAEPVPLPGNNNNGPVHDVAWMPDGNKPSSFAMISGRMPALGSLHHGGTAQPLFLFGNAHRNTIVWSPHGRFVTLAGFGNLAGGMDFWDRNKCKKMPQYINATDKPTFGNTANCAVGYGWAPNSRYFMVSTTSPRMNVDNGVKVFKYNGLQLANLPWDNNKYAPDQLLAAEFVPTPHTVFPDRPQTPPPRRPKAGETTDETTAKSNTDANNNNNNNTTENNHAFVPNNNGNNNNASTPTAFVRPAGRYVPPAARRAGSTSLAERMRREREGNTMGPTKVTTKPGMTSPSNHHHNNRHKRVPVGMSTPTTTTTTTPGGENSGKSKNALRRERQRQAKQKAEAAASAENNNKKEEKDLDPEKRVKKLKKILKQIDDLKQRDAGTLNEDQRKKVASEQSILKELASLK
jgi:translation initiation factor 2A